MLNKFKALPALKKTAIILALIVAFLVLAPLTVKYASAGEIDLFAMLQDLIFRVDTQEARVAELEERIAELEAGEPEEPETGEPADPEEPGDGGGSAPPGDESPDPPGDGGSGDPAPDPTPAPEPEPEPEPWPSLAKIDYMLGPQVSGSGRMVYRFDGTKLYCDFYVPVPEKMKYSHLAWERWEEETEYAFTESIDLAAAWQDWENNGVKPALKGRLPHNVILSLQRIGNTMKFDLLNWLPKDAPYEVRFPERQVYILP